ncbi:MAG: hypothetical protein DRI69_05490 [Bacteroidetes bacterium]|nr:MAG: hypothetical protein DRI69_05490 [Bacteroidota bacterium]
MDKLAYYEVILLMIPVLIVFGAIYLLFRQFFQNQYKLQVGLAASSRGESATRLKLQAYERLMLFCERIAVKSLLLRLQSTQMSAIDLQSAIVIAVQQEFEYNLSQQLYVSDRLWMIIDLAKNQVIEIVVHVGSNVSPDAPAEDLSKQLLLFIESQKNSPVETAKAAIKKESSLIL